MTIYEIMQDARLEETYTQIENLSDDELIELNNDYCDTKNYSEGLVYTNDEWFFTDVYQGDVWQALQDANGGAYNVNESYVMFNIWGLESSDWASDLCQDTSDLAEFALEYGLGCLDYDEIERAGYDALIDKLEERYSDQVENFDDFYAFVSDNEDMDIEDALDEYNEYLED